MNDRIALGLVFGGVSTEHDVSLSSAAAVCRELDRSKYAFIAIGITREGRWLRYFGDEDDIRSDRWHMHASCQQGLSVAGPVTSAQDGAWSKRKAKRLSTRIGGLYGMGILLYLPVNLYAGHISHDLTFGSALRAIRFARRTGTITNEIVCAIGMRATKRFVHDKPANHSVPMSFAVQAFR